VQYLVSYSVYFKVYNEQGIINGSQLAVCRQRWSDYCRKHVDSRRLRFSEHHRAKT